MLLARSVTRCSQQGPHVMLPALSRRFIGMALFSSKDPAPPAPRPQPRADAQPAPAGGTFVGPQTPIEGTATGTEPMTIEGTVRGKINLAADLYIGTQARVE